MLSKETLEAWATLSLRQRVRKLDVEYGIKTSPAGLLTFYRRNKISYKKAPQVTKRELINYDRLSVERREYARILASLIYRKMPIVYMDETSVNVSM